MRLTVFFLSALLAAGVANAEPTLQFGPLRFDMTWDEVDAINPALSWSIEPGLGDPSFSQSRKGSQPLRFGEVDFIPSIASSKNGYYSLWLLSYTSKKNALACQAEGSKVVPALEESVGELGWELPLLDGQRLQPVGNKSAAMVVGWNAKFKAVPEEPLSSAQVVGWGLRAGTALREGVQRIDVKFHTDYRRGECRISVELERMPFK